LRQQSYKLAQQQPVLPPLPGQVNPQGISLGLEPCVFRPITEQEEMASRLHAHQEENEDEEDESSFGGGSGCETARHSPWPQPGDITWQTLPVTMADCKLTDSNSSLSRLSPLLHLGQFQPPSPIPFRWEPQGHPSNILHLPQQQQQQPPPSSMLPSHNPERMDTSGS
jgi:hypothetical protein